MRQTLSVIALLALILFGLCVAGLGIYHDFTHTCLAVGPGGIPPTFRQCVEWLQ